MGPRTWSWPSMTWICCLLQVVGNQKNENSPKGAQRLHGMSWGVKTTCFKAPQLSLGGSGVSIGGVRTLREPRVPLKYGVPFPETSASFWWVFTEAAMIWPEEYLVLGIGFIASLERRVRILAKIPSMFKKSLSHCKQIRKPSKIWLVVSTPLKNMSQIGSFFQVGVKIKNIWNHHLENHVVKVCFLSVTIPLY